MPNKELLPPDDGLLLPADEPGAGLRRSAGASNDLFDQMSAKVAAGAKTLGAKASEIAAEQGPVLKEQAIKLGTKMLDAAAQARGRADEAAREASITWKDPALRRGFWQSYKRPILSGAAALAVLIGGGYGLGCYQAGKVARDAVDGYLIRNHLQQQVSYKDISATPFGRLTLKGVKLASLEVASLSVSGLDPKGSVPDRLEVEWSGLALPAGDLISGGALAAFVGSGFQTLKGDGSFSWRFDARRNELTVRTAGAFAEAGQWDVEAALANINMAAFGQAAPGELALLGLTSLMAVQLKSVSGWLDLSGLAERRREIPQTSIPTDKDQPLFETDPTRIGNSLIEAGMSPSEARDTADALQRFAQTGARISLKSGTDHPVPLFTAGNFLQPQAMNLPALLAAAKISLSN